jgi:beta-lactamase class A
VKIKIRPLGRSKKVYYFDHRNGVLEAKKSRSQSAISMLVVLFIIGGAGALSMRVLHVRQEARARTLQRQTASIDTTQAAGQTDTLKNVDKKAREDEQFAKKVQSKLKSIPGGQKWSVYIRDVKSDRMVSINADNSMEAANLSSLLITAPLESKLSSDKWSYKVGNTTVANCVETLIRNTDQNCRQSLNNYADLKNATSILNGLGFKKTTLNDKEQKTTARDMGELLFRLQNSQVLSDKGRRIVFDGLYAHKMREGIPASCTHACLVANITGENNNVRHDAAIVTNGSSQYVVVIMTNSASWSQIANVAADIQTELQP